MGWIRQNIGGLGVLAATAVLGLALWLMSGCTVDDWVKVDVPREVQSALGVGPKVPLSAARDLIAEYNQKVERQTKDKVGDINAFQRRAARDLQELTERLESEAVSKQADLEDFKRTATRIGASLDERVAHATQVADFIGSMINSGLSAAQSSGLGAFPGGGFLIAGLAGLGGLMIRKPGTQKEIDAAWQEGHDTAAKTIVQGAAVAKTAV